MTAVAVTVASLAAALALRWWVQSRAWAATAVDQWFWKAYIEGVHRQGRFPPHLSQYLLDEAQWYPPLFPLLLTRVGLHHFERWERGIAVALDAIRMALLLGLVWAMPGDRVQALAVAGATFASAPLLSLYNAQLNPRGLGALLLDGGTTCALWWLVGGGAWAWGAAAFFYGLVLLSHKMTTQLLVVLCLAGALALGEWRVAALLPAAGLVALAASRGFYVRVLRAHWDIVTFWARNWRWLHADPVRESPVYGEAGFETPTRLHPRGWRGVARHLRRLGWVHPGLWVLVAAVAARTPAWAPEGRALAGLLAIEVGFALATTFVPVLKCLGAGSLYLYNAAFPAGLLWGFWAASGGAGLVGAVAVAADLTIVVLRTRQLSRASPAGDPGWEEVVSHLRDAPRGPVLCLPQNRYDELAYRTGQPVLYGGHGYGFRRLEPFFPRLAVPLAEIRSRFALRYVVARDGTVNEALARDMAAGAARRWGSYQLVTFEVRPEGSDR